MEIKLPAHAQVVIIGGGIVGCSTAYHLAKAGWQDVILLERKSLACGTTWAAAGLLAQLRQNRQMSNLAKYAIELYSTLEKETGMPTGFVKTGALSVCQTEDRIKEYLRGSARARAFGIDMYQISKTEALDMVPGMSLDTCLEQVFYLPGDAQVNPEDTTQALAKGARMHGVRIFEDTAVLGILIKNGEIHGVKTEQGDIVCQYVVNCAGMWGRDIGKMAGISIPLYAAEHMHAVTTPISGYKDIFPCVRDFDGYTYFKAEHGGLLIGGFEPVAKPWGQKGIPKDFKFTALQEDWDQFTPFLECALDRFPAMEDAEIRHLEVVPESFTPDNAFLVGEAPLVKNLFIGCGMNSVGIASSAGVGRAITQWMTDGKPAEELWPVDVRRYYSWQQNAAYLEERVTESVGILYEQHYPYRQPATARDVIHSPLHARLAEAGAAFSVTAGWERADWFAPKGIEPVHEYDWDAPNWIPYQKEEHLAVRNNVGVYDMCAMSKFIVQGRDAEAALQYLCTNNISGPVGKVIYTPVVNEQGGFEMDITVTRIGEHEYFIVSTADTSMRDIDYMRRTFPAHAHVTVTDVTHGWGMLAVMGPGARKVLKKVTAEDLSNKAFPFATAKFMDVGFARPLAVRMSYVGELGWELYAPTNFMTNMYDRIMEAGKEFGICNVGMQAVNSLRSETGYRHWGNDLTADDTPYEAGLGFGVKLKKGDFKGRSALMVQKAGPLTKRMVQVVLEDQKPKIYGNEPVYRNREIVGEITSGSYAFTLNAATGFAYARRVDGEHLDNEWVEKGTWEVEVQGEMVTAKAGFASPYDPKNERVRIDD